MIFTYNKIVKKRNKVDVALKDIDIQLKKRFDAIPNIASSAMTLSGFSIEKLRQFIYFFGNNQNAAYLHICEGAPELGEEKNNHLIRIKEEVDPNLEMAAIHLRVHEMGGPALLFENVKGTEFKCASNIFGTLDRSKFIFRDTL